MKSVLGKLQWTGLASKIFVFSQTRKSSPNNPGNSVVKPLELTPFQVNRDETDSTVDDGQSKPTLLSPSLPGRLICIAVLETLLIFICFALFAGQATPGVNESHYLTKAKHFWNPSWCPNDLFLSSSFSHWLFYCCFGWITKFTSLSTFAWIGRIASWLLLAYAWRRTSSKLFPLPFIPTLTAIAFVLFNDQFQMAGEWVIGGFEAKVIAYTFVILAMGEMATKNWKLVWPLLGAGAAFHVLVGGWAFLAAGFAWLAADWFFKNNGPSSSPESLTDHVGKFRSQIIPILIGLALLSLGAIPPLLSDMSASPEDARLANLVYVNQRIAHHLTFDAFQTKHIARFAVLTLFCVALSKGISNRLPRYRECVSTLFAFACGCLLIALGGLCLSGLAESNASLAAPAIGLLRFYWFRIADFAVPATTALTLGILVGHWIYIEKSASKKICAFVFAGAIVAAACLVVIDKRVDPRPIADQRSLPTYEDNFTRTQETYRNWLKVCQWINQNTANDASFITPQDQQTFKWYAGRTEVVNWKDIPQDAAGIAEWSQRVSALLNPQKRFELGLMSYSDEQLIALAETYQVDYLLIAQGQVDLSPKPTRLRQVYPTDNSKKSTFVVFEF